MPSTSLLPPGGYTWTNVTSGLSGAPSGRLTAMTWDASDGYVLLFGWESVTGYLTDTWTYANGTWTNITASVLNAPPSSQPYAEMGYDPSTQKVVLFSLLFNSTWTYHAKTWTNITSSAGPHPPPAIYGTLTTDSTDGDLVYFGGAIFYGSEPWNTNTWTFKNGQWSNVTSTAPFHFGRILLTQTADDPMDHGVLAVGLSEWHNVTPYVYHPVTFLFSAGQWTNLTPTLSAEPRLPYIGAFAYDPMISALVLEQSAGLNVSGNLSIYGTTWEYTHSAGWTNVTSTTGTQPDTGIIAGTAVDPADGTLILFGGERLARPVVYPATWILSAAPNVTASISRNVIDGGQSVTLTGAVSGGVSPISIHWSFGDGGSSSSLVVSHAYSQTGLVTARISVTDLLGHTASAIVNVYVNPALALTVNATPSSPAAGSVVSLASAVTGGTAPYAYTWTLGDNHSASAPSLGHSYGSSGTYHVRLMVTDALGSSVSANLTVVVQSAPSTGVSLTSGTGLALIGVIIVLLIVAILLAILLMRKPKSPGPMPAYAPGPVSMPPPPPPPA